MAKQYRLTGVRRLVNRVMTWMTNWGWGGNWLLITRGRHTGILRETPVRPLSHGGTRYLVSPYGEVGWVHNARASGMVTLRRGGVSDQHHVTELPPAEAAPVLKTYVRKVAVVAPYFDAGPDDPLSDFEAEADRHPVFRLEPLA